MTLTQTLRNMIDWAEDNDATVELVLLVLIIGYLVCFVGS